MVSIQHDTTSGTDVGTHAQTFLDHGTTRRAVLRGELWRNRYHRNTMHVPVVSHPPEERAPTRIVNTLGEFAVPHHVAYL